MDAVLSPAGQLIRASARRGLTRMVAMQIVALIASIVALLAVAAVALAHSVSDGTK